MADISVHLHTLEEQITSSYFHEAIYQVDEERYLKLTYEPQYEHAARWRCDPGETSYYGATLIEAIRNAEEKEHMKIVPMLDKFVVLSCQGGDPRIDETVRAVLAETDAGTLFDDTPLLYEMVAVLQARLTALGIALPYREMECRMLYLIETTPYKQAEASGE